MDYSISCVDLGGFNVTSNDGLLTLDIGVSLFFRASPDNEEEISADKLNELVAGGLGFSGATTCRITLCPLIQGIPMHREYMGPDEFGFVQVLAHLVEDLDVWHYLGLRLGPTAHIYTHDESSVSFNYRIEHSDPELPGSVSTASIAAELECVRCHLDFHAQVLGLPGEDPEHVSWGQPHKRGGKRKNGGGSYYDIPRMIVSFTRGETVGLTARREMPFNQDSGPIMAPASIGKKATAVTVRREGLVVEDSDSRSVTQECRNPAAEMGILVVFDHPEVEMIVRTALHHMLFGSRPRGARISGGFKGKALTEVIPAVFDTNRLRVLLSPPTILQYIQC